MPLAEHRANDERLLAEVRGTGVRELVAQNAAVYVPAREAMLRALRDQPGVRWTSDGCHPTQAGHALIAGTWLAAMGL